MKTLFLTVGGSHEPIVTSIERNRPDRIVFVCSPDSAVTVEGPGAVCGGNPRAGIKPDKPNILVQTGFSREECLIDIIDEFDDLNTCYRRVALLIEAEQRRDPTAEMVFDYTGGTKSMAVGLGAAAMEVEDAVVCVIKGLRTDLIKVQDGTQNIRLSRTGDAWVSRQLQNIERTLVARYDYSAGMEVSSSLFAVPNLSRDVEEKIQRLGTVCKAFDAWDKFDHATARRLLQLYRKDYHRYITFLDAVIAARSGLEAAPSEPEIPAPRGIGGFEVVEDLLMNAERRRAQGRYDDAVARLYRTFELFGQVLLWKKHGLLTGDLDTARLPEALRPGYAGGGNGKVQLALARTYDLLADLGTLPAYRDHRGNILNVLQVRNHSILAHGFAPISRSQYEQVDEVLGGFIRAHLPQGVPAPGQFPTQLFTPSL